MAERLVCEAALLLRLLPHNHLFFYDTRRPFNHQVEFIGRGTLLQNYVAIAEPFIGEEGCQRDQILRRHLLETFEFLECLHLD